MGLRILHLAPFNISGVPIALVKAERDLGHHSRLVTLARDRRGYEEDLCLELPFLDFWGTRLLKRLVSDRSKQNVTNVRRIPEQRPPAWRPRGVAETWFVRLRERLWRPRIEQVLRELDFWNFDVYQLDAGLEFFRDGRTVRQLKGLGKKIVCCYTGSDLRTRGVIPAIDAVSDLNVSTEFDHLELHPRLHHVFFPFDVGRLSLRPEPQTEVVRIGHAPTNRQAKGSDRIIAAVKAVARELPVELLLIENLPHREALAQKARCHVFVDQIGDLGYGINSLEALAMGIPTCSCLVPGFAEQYQDHPFVEVDGENLETRLIELVRNPDERRRLGEAGRAWVRRHHDARAVVRRIHALAGLTDRSLEVRNFS